MHGSKVKSRNTAQGYTDKVILYKAIYILLLPDY